MYSRKVDNFYVDNGVQMFDSIPTELADVVSEIMGGKITDVDFVSESAFSGKITKQFSLPDLSSLDISTKNIITSELIALAAQGNPPTKAKNLRELFEIRYGKTAGNIFSDIFKKVYLINPSEVSPSALDHTSLGRLKYLDDLEMMVLKSNPWLDNVLAARRNSIGKVDDYVSIYPDDGKGMRGFCEKALVWLESKGVQIGLKQLIKNMTNNKDGIKVETDKQIIDAEYVVWANDNVEFLGKLMGFESQSLELRHFTPMVLMTFITQKENIKDFTYLQNFCPTASVYRIASAGHYGHQYSQNGESFIICECPTTINSTNWNEPERWAHKVWEECKELEVVSQGANLIKSDVFCVPKTYRIPLVGFESYLGDLSGYIDENMNRIIFQGMDLFNRSQIYRGSEFLLAL